MERTWRDSDFVNSHMPMVLDGVTVTVGGKSAYLYYVSATQLNVLTPPDLRLGSLQVQVTANGTASTAYAVQAQQYSPSFFVFDASHVTTTRANWSLLGPTTLYPAGARRRGRTRP